MSSYRSQTVAMTAPAPDDSDFLDSDSERGAEESIVEQQIDQQGSQTPKSFSQHTNATNTPHMTEMEREMAAVATPATSQTTSTSYYNKRRHIQHPKPMGKIVPMTSNFSFTYFQDNPPQADVLNQEEGKRAAGLPVTEEEMEQHIDLMGRAKKDAVAAASVIAPHLSADCSIHWFNVDSELVYLSFFDDWGPLNVAMFYRFCLHLHHLIGMMQEKVAAKAGNSEITPEVHLILYTSNQPRTKANAALLAAMYAMVCGEMTPADAYHPLSELEFVPFRDAGYGRADYYLTIQDILYGVHRAISEKLLDLMTFDLDEYETYEQVQNGDWNWITPSIIAFASPNDKEYVADLRAGLETKGRATPGLRRPLNATFVKTIKYFKEHNVRLVVRLNNPLYDSRVFEKEGIEHVDMYFDDGSNPSNEIIRAFVEKADAIIGSGGAIAVHCKAGLGRTGVLIGAYLAYKHGFSASESIGFMRIMRPGCVVGPQQHFMYKEATNWIRWREQDDAKMELQRALAKQRLQLVGNGSSSRRRKSGEIEESGESSEEVDTSLAEHDERSFKKAKREELAPQTPKRAVKNFAIDETEVEEEKDEKITQTIPRMKPTPCVGQPRKSPSPSRKRVAQAQAPATVSRMGGGLGGSSRDRLISSNSRTFSGSSFTQNLQRVGGKAEAQENIGQESNQTRTTPSGSRVLGEAHRINIQVACSVQGEVVAVSSQREDHRNAAKEANASVVNPAKSVEAKENECEEELFVQGWQSPQPPSVYIEKLSPTATRSTPAPNVNIQSSDSPTTPSTPTQVLRANSHIREKFGLREAGSHPGTPRSRKETKSEINLSKGNGSSTSSLTSQDAPGSEDEVLQAGSVENVRNSKQAAYRMPAVSEKNSTQVVNNRARISSARQMSRDGSRGTSMNHKASKTALRSASGSSSTSKRSLSASSRVAPSIGIRKGANTANGNYKTTVATAGRVAAVKDQLAKKQQAAAKVPTDLQQRASLKRPRVYRPEVGSTPVLNLAPTAKTLLPSHAANRMETTTITSTSQKMTLQQQQIVNKVTPNNVPRFAAATAASTAKSQNPLSQDHLTRFQKRDANTSSFFTRPNMIPSQPSSSGPNRLNGRNVRRRRSSFS